MSVGGEVCDGGSVGDSGSEEDGIQAIGRITSWSSPADKAGAVYPYPSVLDSEGPQLTLMGVST